jgi:Fic/DOC family
VLPRLVELQRHIVNAHQSPFQTAIVALAMTSRIHPFMDGNGQLSRILFHAMLRKHDMGNELYAPVKNFYALSDFAFEIRLRHTFLTGDWAEITVYFCHVLQLWRKRAGLLTASAASLIIDKTPLLTGVFSHFCLKNPANNRVLPQEAGLAVNGA